MQISNNFGVTSVMYDPNPSAPRWIGGASTGGIRSIPFTGVYDSALVFPLIISCPMVTDAIYSLQVHPMTYTYYFTCASGGIYAYDTSTIRSSIGTGCTGSAWFLTPSADWNRLYAICFNGIISIQINGIGPANFILSGTSTYTPSNANGMLIGGDSVVDESLYFRFGSYSIMRYNLINNLITTVVTYSQAITAFTTVSTRFVKPQVWNPNFAGPMPTHLLYVAMNTDLVINVCRNGQPSLDGSGLAPCAGCPYNVSSTVCSECQSGKYLNYPFASACTNCVAGQ